MCCHLGTLAAACHLQNLPFETFATAAFLLVVVVLTSPVTQKPRRVGDGGLKITPGDTGLFVGNWAPIVGLKLKANGDSNTRNP